MPARKFTDLSAAERTRVGALIASAAYALEAAQSAVASLYYDPAASMLFSTESEHDTTSLGDLMEACVDNATTFDIERREILDITD